MSDKNKRREIYHLYPWTQLEDKQLDELKSMGKLEIEYTLPEFICEDPMRDYGIVSNWDEFINDEEFREYWSGIPNVYESVNRFLFEKVAICGYDHFKFSDFYEFVLREKPIYKDSEQRLRSILEHYMDERLEYSYSKDETSNPDCLYDIYYRLDVPHSEEDEEFENEFHVPLSRLPRVSDFKLESNDGD